MKKATILLIICLFISLGTAHAGIMGKAKSWITLEVTSLALSAILTVLGGALGIVFRRISRTFKEAGEFMTTLGAALEDKRLTREELASIVKEGKDIFEIWK